MRREYGSSGLAASLVLVSLIILGYVGYTFYAPHESVSSPIEESRMQEMSDTNTTTLQQVPQENSTTNVSSTNQTTNNSQNCSEEQGVNSSAPQEDEKCLIGHLYHKNATIIVTSAYNNSGEVQIKDEFQSSLLVPELNVEGEGIITQRRVSQWYLWYVAFTRSKKDTLYHDIAIGGSAWDHSSWVEITYMYENGSKLVYNLTGDDNTYHIAIPIQNPHPGQPCYIEVWLRYYFNREGVCRIISTEKFVPVPEEWFWGTIYEGQYEPPEAVHIAHKEALISVWRSAGNTNESCIGTQYIPLINESHNVPLPDDGRRVYINISSGVEFYAPLCWPSSGAGVDTQVYIYLDQLNVLPKAFLERLTLTIVNENGEIVEQETFVANGTVVIDHIYFILPADSSYTIYISGVVYGIDDVVHAVYLGFTEYWL